MQIENISVIIEKSVNEITERYHRDECSNCWVVNRNEREGTIEVLGELIDLGLINLEQLMDEIFRDVFESKKENPGFYKKEENLDFYKNLDNTDKHLIAIRNLAEIKRYFEAKNDGINKVRFIGCD